MLLNGGQPGIHVPPVPLPSDLDLGFELGGRAQQVAVRLPACVRPLVLSLSTSLDFLASGLGLLASSSDPGVQGGSTESPEKRSSSRDHGRDNREVGHDGSLHTTGRVR